MLLGFAIWPDMGAFCKGLTRFGDLIYISLTILGGFSNRRKAGCRPLPIYLLFCKRKAVHMEPPPIYPLFYKTSQVIRWYYS